MANCLIIRSANNVRGTREFDERWGRAEVTRNTCTWTLYTFTRLSKNHNKMEGCAREVGFTGLRYIGSKQSLENICWYCPWSKSEVVYDHSAIWACSAMWYTRTQNAEFLYATVQGFILSAAMSAFACRWVSNFSLWPLVKSYRQFEKKNETDRSIMVTIYERIVHLSPAKVWKALLLVIIFLPSRVKVTFCLAWLDTYWAVAREM